MKKVKVTEEDKYNLIIQQARLDFKIYFMLMQDDYIDNWHIDVFADAFMELFKGLKTRGGIKNLMLAAPPQMAGKTTLFAHAATFAIGNLPDLSILYCSYKEDLAQAQSKKTLDIIRSKKYKDIFGATLDQSSRAKKKWSLNTGKGSFLPFSINTIPTGNTCDLLMIDDPISNASSANSIAKRNMVYAGFKELLDRTIENVGATMITFTRWHLDDPIGRLERELIDKGKKLTDEWTVIFIPAIGDKKRTYKLSSGKTYTLNKGQSFWENRFTIKDLESRKSKISKIDWACRYLQNPIATGITILKDLKKCYITEEELEAVHTPFRVLMIDSSEGASDDYTGFSDVMLSSDLKTWYVRAWHEKLTVLEIQKKILRLNKINNYDATGIEATSAGKIIALTVNRLLTEQVEDFVFMDDVIPISHRSISKIDRVRSVLPLKYEKGEIFHIKGQTKQLEEEMATFPVGVNDDIVDSLAYVEDLINHEDASFDLEDELEIIPI